MPVPAYARTNLNPSRPTPGSMVGHSIDNGNLQFVKLVGVGTYGEVYRTVDRRNGEAYAVKVLPRKSTPPAATAAPACAQQQATPPSDEPFVDARLLSREVSLYARIPPHPNIVRLERMLHTQDQLFMVMENCPGGDLYENISSNPYFHLPGNDALIRRLFLQLVSAIEHCHNHGVYHRDIKPENVLVTRDCLNVKLIDFGLSTSEPWCREIGCGSAYYMSPECQGGINNNLDRYAAAPNDVWALGVILINLTTSRNPWNRAHVSDPLFRRYLTDKSFLCRAIHASPQFEHLIHRVLDINPTTRCTLQELRQLVQDCPYFVQPPSAIGARAKQQQQQHQKPPVQASPNYAVRPACAAAPQPAANNAQSTAWSSKIRQSIRQTAATKAATTASAVAGAAAASKAPNNKAMCSEVAQVPQEYIPDSIVQQHTPTSSSSFSSTDSIFESLSASKNVLGYPPLNLPGVA